MATYFEDFRVGQTFTSPRRTITEADLVGFAGLTGDFNPLHTDEIHAVASPYGGRIAHGPMLIGMTFGLLSRVDLLDGTVQGLRRLDWRFDGPIRPGDTIHVAAEVLEATARDDRPDAGRVQFSVRIVNQRGESVQSGSFTVIVARKG